MSFLVSFLSSFPALSSANYVTMKIPFLFLFFFDF